MKIDVMDALKNIAASNHVNLTVYKSGASELPEFDMGLRSLLGSKENKEKAFARLINNVQEGSVYYVPDYFAAEYCIAKIPENEQEYGDFLIIGPYLKEYMDEAGVKELMNTASIPVEYRTKLEEYFRAVPIVKSCEQWRELCNRFIGMLYGGIQLCVEYLTFAPEKLEFQKNGSAQVLSQELIEERYRCEEKLMQAVSEGKTEQGLRAFAKMQKYRTAWRQDSPFCGLRNGMITMNTLLRKAAEYGGVHPVHIERLSVQLAKRIEMVSSQREYERMINEMIHKYCLLVQNYSTREYSPVVQKVTNHINLKLSQDISLKKLAKEYEVSASYLSALFKREMGLTITDYTNQQRIRRAIVLLNSTNLSVSDIAAECGIYDTSYFRKLFKKYVGKTPTEYRKQIGLNYKIYR